MDLPPPPPPPPGPPAGPPPGPPSIPPGVRPVFGTAGEERTDPRTIAGHALPLLLGLGGYNLIGGLDLGALVFTVVLAGIFAAVDAVQWSHRWYEVGPTELRVRSGILSRDQRVIPYGRIQQVDHRQKLVYQMLGLAVVHIDTAAEAGQTSIVVDALPVAEAERLRSTILERRQSARSPAPTFAPGADHPPVPATASAPSTLLSIPDGRLALAGATGTGLAAALLVLLWPIAFLLDAGLVSEEQVTIAAEEASRTTVSPGLVLAGALALLLVVPIAAGVLSIVQWHGYQLAASDEDLLVRHGLFDVRRLTIPRRRVQQVTLLDNPLRRRLGLVAIRLHSAASGGDGRGVAGGGNVLQIPLVDRDAAGRLLTELMGDERWQPQPVSPRPEAARRRAILRRCAVLVAAASPIVLLAWPFGLVALAVGLLGVPWGEAAHRRAGFATTDSTATLAAGVLLHREDVVALERLQSSHTTSSPFQRRVGLATLHLDVAGAKRAPSLYDMGADDADRRRRTLDPVHAPRA